MSDICLIFRKNICMHVVHILRDRISFVSEKVGGGGGGVSKFRKFMTDIHKVLFKIFCIFFTSQRTTKKYSCLALKRCNNCTTKFDVTTFLSLNAKNFNFPNYDILLNSFVDDLI